MCDFLIESAKSLKTFYFFKLKSKLGVYYMNLKKEENFLVLFISKIIPVLWIVGYKYYLHLKI